MFQALQDYLYIIPDVCEDSGPLQRFFQNSAQFVKIGKRIQRKHILQNSQLLIGLFFRISQHSTSIYFDESDITNAFLEK